MIPRLTACCCLVTLVLIAGCDGGSSVRTVEGKVSYAGKFIDRGMIMFQPSTGRLASAPIESDGHYSISLPPESYSVFLNVPFKLPADFKEGDPMPPPDPNPLPGKYSQKESSGLTATIELGSDVQTVNFDLK